MNAAGSKVWQFPCGAPTATFGPGSKTLSPESPVLLTFKVLFSSPGEPLETQVQKARAELLATPYREYERRLREQLSMLFSRAGFDVRRDIAAIVLNRWGHAYLSPQPGFFFGREGAAAPGDVLRHQPFGRVAFANSDLAGIMDHRSLRSSKRSGLRAGARANVVNRHLKPQLQCRPMIPDDTPFKRPDIRASDAREQLRGECSSIK